MNNPPWMTILEAHSQAHEAWWFAFGLKEKRIMSTSPTDPPDDQIWLDDEGRAMIVNSHHYTAENIGALISELKRLEDPQQTTLGDWNNKDWRTWSGVLWRVLAALATDVPLFDPQDAQKRIDSLRAALNQIAYSRWSTETPGQFVEVLQKMARDALIANAKLAKDRLAQPAPGTPSPKIHISKHDAADWLESRSAIIEALEKAGLCLWSNAEGFWIAPTPAAASDATRLEWFLRSRSDMPLTIEAWRAAVDAAMRTVPPPGEV